MHSREEHTSQYPVHPTVDLRDMLRQYLVGRSLSCMQRSAERRREALQPDRIDEYRRQIRSAVRSFYGDLPAGPHCAPPRARLVGSFDGDGYRIENVLFESFPGWEINATVYVPLDHDAPFPAVVVPCGHGGKEQVDHHLPAQFFARCGYLSVIFDPPMFGEKGSGNDHFTDGVRCYLVGENSSRYFIADALRCIDYLETRGDVDLSCGVAMTGVSGGGTTTALAGVLDERIKVAGVSCCLSPIAKLDLANCYAACPETHMWRRYAEGIDETDLLCAAAPRPTLVMAGESDEVFKIESARRIVDEAKAFYASTGAGASFELFVDHCGHSYTLAQARRFVRFMNRWLLGQPDRPVCDLPDDAVHPDPSEHLRCHPRTDVNMRSRCREVARELEATRERNPANARALVEAIVTPAPVIAVPESEEGKRFRVWNHYWQEALIRPEPGIELPATLLYPVGAAGPAVIHFDDRGRNRLLYRNGLLAQAGGTVAREHHRFAVLTVDLRGWGDSFPAMYPYEIASWGGVDRFMAYTSAALGDSVMATRIRDALASLAYLRSRAEVDPRGIVVTGCGLGGVVALHVATLDASVAGLITWDSLASFRDLIEADDYPWPADAFMPQALLHYDLPELAASLQCRAHLLNSRNGSGATISAERADELNSSVGRVVYEANVDDASLVACIRDALGSCPCRLE